MSELNPAKNIGFYNLKIGVGKVQYCICIYIRYTLHNVDIALCTTNIVPTYDTWRILNTGTYVLSTSPFPAGSVY